MRNILNQIEQALDANIYYLALFTTLSIPDICGALDSTNGGSKKKRYINWFDKHVVPQTASRLQSQTLPRPVADSLSETLGVPQLNAPLLTGVICYQFRCSLLHQGRARVHKKPLARVLFLEPRKSTIRIDMNQADDALVFDLHLFCRDVVDATRKWLGQVENTERFKKNYAKFARVHPEGLPPYIGGFSVVG